METLHTCVHAFVAAAACTRKLPGYPGRAFLTDSTLQKCFKNTRNTSTTTILFGSTLDQSNIDSNSKAIRGTTTSTSVNSDTRDINTGYPVYWARGAPVPPGAGYPQKITQGRAISPLIATIG
eukprot:2202762-Rhodomonas_salina.6